MPNYASREPLGTCHQHEEVSGGCTAGRAGGRWMEDELSGGERSTNTMRGYPGHAPPDQIRQSVRVLGQKGSRSGTIEQKEVEHERINMPTTYQNVQ